MTGELKRGVRDAMKRAGLGREATTDAVRAATLTERRLLERSLVLQGQALEAARRGDAGMTLDRAEFSVFSQFGEDGVLAWLVDQLPGIPSTFIEFGVEDYGEANSRYLVMARYWRGLVMDGSDENVRRIRASDIAWRHGIDAVAAFITRENINDLIRQHGPTGDIGLLSTDIDGNDYWVSEAIDVVRPWVVAAEYNALMGPERAVSVPYQADFQRTAAHHSNLHWGCSLGALHHLWSGRGYALVGCNRAGNNAFFVRNDVRPAALAPLSVRDAFRPAVFREARNEGGDLMLVPSAELVAALGDLQLVEVQTGEMVGWRMVNRG